MGGRVSRRRCEGISGSCGWLRSGGIDPAIAAPMMSPLGTPGSPFETIIIIIIQRLFLSPSHYHRHKQGKGVWFGLVWFGLTFDGGGGGKKRKNGNWGS